MLFSVTSMSFSFLEPIVHSNSRVLPEWKGNLKKFQIKLFGMGSLAFDLGVILKLGGSERNL